MSNTIVTTGDQGAEITSTEYESGWSSGRWAREHNGNLDGASVSGHDTLKTCWPHTSGEVCETTDRESGESDAEFKDRHETAYGTKMIDYPPIPEEPP